MWDPPKDCLGAGCGPAAPGRKRVRGEAETSRRRAFCPGLYPRPEREQADRRCQCDERPAFVPDSGYKKAAPRMRPAQNRSRRSDPGELEEPIAYLTRASHLTSQEARRVVEEVLSYVRETPEDFVRWRQRTLQAKGPSNSTICVRLAAALRAQLVAKGVSLRDVYFVGARATEIGQPGSPVKSVTAESAGASRCGRRWRSSVEVRSASSLAQRTSGAARSAARMRSRTVQTVCLGRVPASEARPHAVSRAWVGSGPAGIGRRGLRPARGGVLRTRSPRAARRGAARGGVSRG